MSKRIKLSVLIPVYNREAFVAQAINSVLNQPFEDYEIICSDNASTDNTYEVLKFHQKKDSRIKIFRNKENLGPVLNWKACLDNAQGEFIHWLWSDDWVEKNFYTDAFDLMDKNQTQIVSTWNYRSDFDQPKYISWQFSYDRVPGKIAAKKVLLQTRELPVSPAAYIFPANLVRKHFYMQIPNFKNLNPVKNGVGTDSLMVIGCCYDTKEISILKKPSVVFRKHDNISSILSRNEVIRKLYLISHLWFMSKNTFQLSISELTLHFLKSLLKGGFPFFLKSIFNKSVAYSLIHPQFFTIDKYKSIKAVFKS